ncbi:MMPL family transporter [Streptomyces sp. SID12501]|uniref:MMPL family transporter n=1 Tax=Streptomyces sp. SID12501 TaxID=2706042 RepID=A0A6B3BPV4_9ACTN|nr:MMPL family transporter [Streptomyces sp. SID12501]NEC86385.1 MMPL family transporter [Streptomyces sp. SID12501]
MQGKLRIQEPQVERKDRRSRSVWWVLSVAALFAAVCALLAEGSFDRLGQGGYTPGNTEAEHAEQALARQFTVPVGDVVLLVRTRASADDSRTRTAGAAFTERVARMEGVHRSASYWTTGDPALRSRNGRSALVVAELRGTESDRVRTAARIVPQLTGSRGTFEVSATGPAWAKHEAVRQSRTDLMRAELFAAPLVLLVLAAAYGSLVAIIVPMAIGLLSVTGGLASLRLLSELTEVSAFAANITTALGFALAVDYGLFLVARYREGITSGMSEQQAVAEAARTAGHTVLFSALTIALALGALLLLPMPFLTSLVWAGITVVTLSAAVALGVVPALLTVLGPYLDRGDLWRGIRRRAGEPSAESPGWRRVALAVARRPVLFGGGCCLLLAILALPFGHARFSLVDERNLPASASSHATAGHVLADFASAPHRGLKLVLTPAAPGERTGDAVTARYAQRLSELPGVTAVRSPAGTYRDGHRTAPASPASAAYHGRNAILLTLTAPQVPGSPAAERLVTAVRALPAPGPVLVGGPAALSADTTHAMAHALPRAGLAILISTFALLLLFTRSLLLPVKAILVGLLSLTASFGTVVLVFQDNHAKWLVGDFTPTSTLENSIPPLLFCLAFGLSIDYELLLLSRIKEHYTTHGDNRSAVVFGLARTGRLVTSSALIVAISMGALMLSGITSLKILGFGLALAVLVDATLVRGILVPAAMCLAGRANWWLPRVPTSLTGRLRPPRRLEKAAPDHSA